ncbi:3-isopropylmalate dehydratase [Candidatus Riflebacteria bacterium]
MRQMQYQGKVWVILDESGKAIHNIDTDMIFHNSHLHITAIEDMGQHSFGNLDAWRDFPKKCQQGDIVLCGENFGAGSSRQQAVDCFRSLGVSVIIAESFGAIYKRNAINSGMPIMEAPGIFSAEFKLSTGDTLALDLEKGLIKQGENEFQAKPMSEIQKNIYLAGDLFAYGKSLV